MRCIPKGCEILKLSGCCDVRDGTHDSPKYVTNGYPLITSKNVKNGILDFENINLISEEDFNSINKRSKVENGDIIMPMIGTIGNPLVVETDREFAIKNVALLKFDKKMLFNKYTYYFLKSPSFEHGLKKINRGGTQKFISLGDIRNIPIPLPPLSEQKRIASILDQSDAIRRKRQQAIDKLNSLIPAIFYDMFGDPANNSKGWAKVRFGDLIAHLGDYHSNGSYQTLRENVTLLQSPDYALMVRTTDLEKNNFTDGVKYISEGAYNHLKKSQVFGGEIIINKIGSAGKVYLMPHLGRPVSLGMNQFMLNLSDKANNIYIYNYLTMPYGQYIISKRVRGAVTKTITKDAVRDLEILLPPNDLQQEFLRKANEIQKLKDKQEQSAVKDEALFNSLVQRAFKGEL